MVMYMALLSHCMIDWCMARLMYLTQKYFLNTQRSLTLDGRRLATFVRTRKVVQRCILTLHATMVSLGLSESIPNQVLDFQSSIRVEDNLVFL